MTASPKMSGAVDPFHFLMVPWEHVPVNVRMYLLIQQTCHIKQGTQGECKTIKRLRFSTRILSQILKTKPHCLIKMRPQARP